MSELSEEDRELEQRLGHKFGDPALLLQALTHSSIEGAKHYERLEFLGDAVLYCVISKLLYDGDPGADEGRLSVARISLVNGTTQSKVGKKFGLDKVMRVGEAVAGLPDDAKYSIVGEVLEALFGAIFIDAGYDAAESCVRKAFATELTNARLMRTDQLKPIKTRLQEFLQAKNLARPTYDTRKDGSGKTTSGATFSSECTVELHGGKTIVKAGSGDSKKAAEYNVAEKMLLTLERTSG